MNKEKIKKLSVLESLEIKIDRLENILIDLADNAMDDNLTGNDLKGILKKYKVVIK